MTATPTTAREFAAAIYGACLEQYTAEYTGDTKTARAASRRAAGLDRKADAAGFGYRDGVSLSDLDTAAAAAVYGPESGVGRAAVQMGVLDREAVVQAKADYAAQA